MRTYSQGDNSHPVSDEPVYLPVRCNRCLLDYCTKRLGHKHTCGQSLSIYTRADRRARAQIDSYWIQTSRGTEKRLARYCKRFRVERKVLKYLAFNVPLCISAYKDYRALRYIYFRILYYLRNLLIREDDQLLLEQVLLRYSEELQIWNLRYRKHKNDIVTDKPLFVLTKLAVEHTCSHRMSL